MRISPSGVNAQGTFLVAQAAAAAGVRRFVYASTLSLYEGNSASRRARQFSEEHPPAPCGVYALTTYFGEEALRAHAREGKLSVVSLRLTLPTEPESGRLSASSIRILGACAPPRLMWAGRSGSPWKSPTPLRGDPHRERDARLPWISARLEGRDTSRARDARLPWDISKAVGGS